MAEYRTERLGQLIQEKISSLILEGRIKDPRVTSFLSITRVNVSRDLSYADVYVSHIREQANIGRGAEGLQSAAGFIQSQLNAVMRIRKIPHLRFHADTGVREGFDLVKKIERLVEDDSHANQKFEGIPNPGFGNAADGE
jgi:ribosome-binding factor A